MVPSAPAQTEIFPGHVPLIRRLRSENDGKVPLPTKKTKSGYGPTCMPDGLLVSSRPGMVALRQGQYNHSRTRPLFSGILCAGVISVQGIPDDRAYSRDFLRRPSATSPANGPPGRLSHGFHLGGSSPKRDAARHRRGRKVVLFPGGIMRKSCNCGGASCLESF